MSSNWKLWVGVVMLLLGSFGFAAAQRLDEDINGLQYVGQDSQRVEMLNRISLGLLREYPDSAMAFASQAMGLSRKLNFLPGQARARLMQARCFAAKQDFSDAAASLKISKSEFAQLLDSLGQAECALLEGQMALKQSQWAEALYHSHTADSLIGDSSTFAPAEVLRGQVFAALGNPQIAKAYFEHAKHLASQQGDVRGRALASENLAETFLQIGKSDSALLQFEDAFDGWRALGDRPSQALALIGAGTAATRAGKPEAGRKYLVSAIDLCKEDGLILKEAIALTKFAENEIKMGLPDSAQNHSWMALSLLRKTKHTEEALDARIGIVQAALIRSDFARAFRYGDTAVALADSFGLFRQQAIVNQLLSKAWQSQGDFRRALQHYQVAEEAKDSLQIQRERNAALAIQVKLEDEQSNGSRKAEARQMALNAAKAKELSQMQFWLFLVIGLLLLAVILLFFLFIGNKRKKEKLANELKEKLEELSLNKQELSRVSNRLQETDIDYDALVSERTDTLQEAVQSLIEGNEMLESFLYRSSNELMGPVSRLKGLVEVSRLSGQVKDLVFAIDLVDAVAVYMDRSLRKLLQIQELKHGFRDIGKVNVEDLLLDVRSSLKELPGVKYPDIRFDDRLKRPIVTDRKLIRIILENVMENACIFRKDLRNDSPLMEVSLYKEEDDVVIKIKDEGIGIPKNIIDHVSKLFFRGSSRSKGQGMGLYLVQRSLLEIQGRIKIESKEGSYTLVTLRIQEQPI